MSLRQNMRQFIHLEKHHTQLAKNANADGSNCAAYTKQVAKHNDLIHTLGGDADFHF